MLHAMQLKLGLSFALALLSVNSSPAQKLTADIPYIPNGHERQAVDIYTPEKPSSDPLPVMFWIHGGGWQAGDKNDVALKPKALTERGFVFVSTGYRLLPEVTMDELTDDVAKSLEPEVTAFVEITVFPTTLYRNPITS